MKNEENICQIAIMENGSLIRSEARNGYTIDDKVHVASATKSITAMLLGMAIDKGIIESVEQNVLDFFPEYSLKRGEKTLPQIKLRHVLSMTAPYKFKSEPWTKVCCSDDWAKAALDLMGGRAGITGTFKYTSLGIQVISEIIARASGISTLDFANRYLFEPLGISSRSAYSAHDKEEHLAFVTRKTPQDACWFTDAGGNATAGFGLCLSAEELAKIGQLIMNRGEWEGKRILSRQWIGQMLTARTDTGEKFNDMKYGYFWWIVDEGRQVYAAMGDSGNLLYLDMNRNVVAAVTATFKPGVMDRVEYVRQLVEE